MKKLITMIFVLVIAITSANAELTSFSGSLSTPSGVTATGNWDVNGFVISWDIERQANNSWLYSYSFNNLAGNNLLGTPSHLTLEVSPNVTLDDFWGYNGDSELGEMDGITNALKLDWEADDYSFYSWRAPVWGDFYSKDGTAGGFGLNTAMNEGFGDPDPMMAASNGTVGNKILRPDTTTVVPEPATLLLVGLGMVGIGLRKKFMNKKK